MLSNANESITIKPWMALSIINYLINNVKKYETIMLANNKQSSIYQTCYQIEIKRLIMLAINY